MDVSAEQDGSRLPRAAAASPAAPPKSAATSATKPAAPVQVPLDNALTHRYRERFAAAIVDALEDRKQPYLVIDAARLLEIARYSRDEEKFDLLEDYTAVDWPRREKRSTSGFLSDMTFKTQTNRDRMSAPAIKNWRANWSSLPRR